MQSLPSANSTVPPYILGNANIEQKYIDDAVDFLKKNLSQYCSSYLENKTKLVYPYRGVFSIPSYLSKIDVDPNNRFYADMYFKIKNLNPTNPVESLLISLSQRITELGFPCNEVELRFEKGCFNSVANFWHYDISANEEQNMFSLCYSNVANWSTKILENSAVDIIGGIPLEIDPKTLEKIESLATSSEFGDIYNVKKVLHRPPVWTDFPFHVSAEHYRIFMRFNNLY